LASSPRVVPAVQHMFGFDTTHSSLYNARLLSDPRIINVQVGVIALGTLGALWAMWRIVDRDLVPVSRSAVAVRITSLGLVVLSGVAAAWLYVAMQAAS
jgi:hypothetical protein